MQKWLSTLGSGKPAAHPADLEANFQRSLALKEQGNLHLERGELSEAVDRFEEAVCLSPKFAEGYCNLGIALKLQNRYQEAERAFREALAVNPALDRVHYHLGTLYAMHGLYERAATHLGKTLELDPTFMSCYPDLSLLHYTHGHLALAQQVVDQGLAIDPTFEPLHLSRGNLFIASGDVERGIAAYEDCLALAETHPDGFGGTFQMAQVNLYLVLRSQGNMARANACLADLLAKGPDDPSALNKLGEIHLQRGEPETAKQFLLRAFAATPLDHDVLNNLGLAEQRTGNFEAGIDLLRRASAVRRDWVDPVLNLGKAYEAAGELTKAADHYQHALKLDASSTEATYRLSLLRLLSGEFQDGWREYESRWLMPHMQAQRRTFTAPLWLGQQPLFGKSILIHAEQGLGDTIHAVRFLEQLATTGATIYLEVQPQLRELCARMPTAPFARKIIARGSALPTVDFHCPLMSLPLALRMRDFVGLPGRKPYMRAPADREQLHGLAMTSWPRRVGVVWSDDQTVMHGIDRSVPLSEMARLMNIEGIDFFLLHSSTEKEQALLPDSPSIHQMALSLENMGDLAAVIANLELVIAADSTIAHLSAAMGKPTWILVDAAPNWHWMLERPECPWYPSVKLYRQPELHDWKSVVDRVSHDLGLYFQNRT